MRRTLTVILASDVAGYSRLVAEREEETIQRFSRAAVVFSDLVKKHQGSVFNTAGDAILARFDSAVDAARCAIDIQDANNAQNAEIPQQEKLLFRIGVAIGDVLVAENGDLLGDAVNIAARLESLAEPGGICISDDVRAQVLNKIRLNVVDLGDQSLRNIPRAIRVFKLVPNFQLAPERRRLLGRKIAAGIPILWLVSGIALLGALSLAALVWHLHPFSPNSRSAGAEQPFDPSRVPLLTDRARDSLANYEREPDFKAIAISREGLGVGLGAPDLESAKREALDRCQQRDPKGYCRIYAVGNKVHWSKTSFFLPADLRADALDISLTADDAELFGRVVPGLRIEAYLTAKGHKALAVSRSGYWLTSNRASRAEAIRLAFERCSDIAQTTCVLLSLDGFLTHQIPRSHPITQPFTLAGENEMTEADKERIGKIYLGKDWRAIARGGIEALVRRQQCGLRIGRRRPGPQSLWRYGQKLHIARDRELSRCGAP